MEASRLSTRSLRVDKVQVRQLAYVKEEGYSEDLDDNNHEME